MSRLILTRRPNESVVITDHVNNTRTTLLLLSMRNGQCKFNFGSGESVWCPVGHSYEFKGVDLKVEILRIEQGQVRFAFTAPPHVNIVRTEIVGRPMKAKHAQAAELRPA